MSESGYIGVDIGGTNVRSGIIKSDGSLRTWHSVPIEASQGPHIGIKRIIALIEKGIEEANCRPEAIGIGATGPVDRKLGAIQNPYTLPTWEDVDIVTPLREHFRVPVVLENDADAAALGESWIGAGRGVSKLVVVTVGTGIGTAYILDGKIYRGTNENHPEGGHIPIDPNGPICYCGANGCWESLASGSSIGEYARMQSTGKDMVLLKKAANNLENIDAELVALTAREGNPLSLKIIDRSAYYLALGVVSLLQLFLPDCVVFTGGVMRSMDLFEARIHQVIAQHSIMNPIHLIPLRSAQLGQQAGMFGAAKAAMNEVGSSIPE